MNGLEIGLFVDDEEMSGIDEALKVFPTAVKKKPSLIPGYKEMMRGLELWGKGGKVKEEEMWMIRELSNREFFTREGVDMSGLFCCD